ncbi:MAG TPA: hydrogenase [Desulfobulbus sp.]|nr:hydrogenase [Desulfobulbus sp.]
MKDIIRMNNNEAIALDEIPLLSFDAFQEQLTGVMEEESDVLACFACNGSSDDATDDLELITLIGCRTTNNIAVFRSHLASSYPSLTCHWPQFHLFEREMAEQFGVTPEGHPWLKPVRFHQVWQGDKDVWGRDIEQHPLVGDMQYFKVEGDEIHEVGVGPVHAGIIEPGHFRFQCFGEIVLHLEISLGFQHRGAEKLLLGGPHAATPYQMETLAGDTTVGNMLGYSQIMESLGGTEVNRKIQDLRIIALELERLANHVGDIGALALDVGYLPTSSFCGRLRGDYLNMTAHICGSRFGRGMVRPGGQLFDIDIPLRDKIKGLFESTTKDTLGALKLFFTEPSVLGRLDGAGEVHIDDAKKLGLTGVAGRACGLDTDSRRWYPATRDKDQQYPLITGEEGDVFARAHVRRLEINEATAIIRKKLDTLSSDPTIRMDVPPPRPNMLAVSLVEGWRGRLTHVALTDEQGKFRRYKVVDPSFFNWSGLAMSLRDEQISDFPICNKSFNLSYCGFDL